MTKAQVFVFMIMLFFIFSVATYFLGNFVGSIAGAILVGAFVSYGATQPGGVGLK